MKMTINNYSYQIEILDGTHLRYRIDEVSPPNAGWATPLHILQVSDAMINALNAAGMIVPSKNKRLQMSYFKTEVQS
jgi:hypothetical protein